MTPTFADYRLPPGRHGIPRDQVRANQRWRMLGACAQLIAESGYENVTVAAVVGAAAVSKATFYQQFEDLPACISAVFEMAAQNAMAVTQAACDAVPDRAAALPVVVASILELIAAEPSLAHVLTDAALDDVDGLYARRLALSESWATLLAELGSGSGEHGPSSRLSLHRVRATKSWIWERLYAGGGSTLPSTAPQLVRLLAG